MIINKKRIAFIVNFEKTIFFQAIANQMSVEGDIDFFWISGKPIWTKWLLKQGVTKDAILDITFTRKISKKFKLNDEYNICRSEMLSIEKNIRISYSYIILMDRKLRDEPYEFALDYLIFVYAKLKMFYLVNNINVVFGETTHAAEALAAEIGAFLNVRHYHIAQITIPGNRFGFFQGFSMDKLSNVSISINNQYTNWTIYARKLIDKKFKPYTFTFLSTVPKFKLEFITKFFIHLKNLNIIKNGDQTAITLVPIILYRLKRIINYFLEKRFIKFHKLVHSNSYLLYLIQRQPEATIDLYGGYYSNQVELIKNISRICPATHGIFIKLHPNGMGEYSFAKLYRLSKLPRVKIIDYKEDSLTLVKNCTCVITVTGTVGIEASLIGKPVLLLSDYYYERINGIFRINGFYELRNKIIEITSGKLKIELQETDVELNKLYENSFPGIIGDPVTTPGVIDKENILMVIDGIKRILKL
jgi:hypothetical protein